MQNEPEQSALRWADRLMRCLAAQSPPVEFLLVAAAVLLAGNVSKSQGFFTFLARGGEAIALLGFLLASSVGLRLYRSSSL